MRFSVTALALGLTCVTALAVPMLPQAWVPDIAFAPARTALPQLVAEGQRVAGSILVSAAMADEPPVPSIDFSKLVRVKDRDYEISFAPGVSSEVLSQSNVRKIGYGRVSDVTVATTATGTYSTDGLFSPHVLYPGIKVTPRPATQNPGGGGFGTFWRTGFGWVALPINIGKGTTSFGRIDGGGYYITGQGTTCMQGPGYLACS